MRLPRTRFPANPIIWCVKSQCGVDSYWLLIALSCLIRRRLHTAQVAGVHCSDLWPFDTAALFSSFPLDPNGSGDPKRSHWERLARHGTFRGLQTMTFSSAEVLRSIDAWVSAIFSRLFFYGGGKWLSPCEIGSRESSADQPVCRLWGRFTVEPAS